MILDWILREKKNSYRNVLFKDILGTDGLNLSVNCGLDGCFPSCLCFSLTWWAWQNTGGQTPPPESPDPLWLRWKLTVYLAVKCHTMLLLLAWGRTEMHWHCISVHFLGLIFVL